MGLGRFGAALALELMREGEEVLGIDGTEQVVQSLAGELTHVVHADTTNEKAMAQLGVGEFSRAVIGVGNDLEASILSASVALNLGVRDVWAKAISDAHARILQQLGVHHVVRPEHDMGVRVAHLVRGRMIDFIEFDDDYVFAKARAPESLAGRSLSASRLRQTHGVTIVGHKPRDGVFTYTSHETVLEPGDTIIVSGPEGKVEAFCDLS